MILLILLVKECLSSAVHCQLHYMTPHCVYHTESKVVWQKTKKKRKVQLKVRRTGLAHRSSGVCHFGLSFGSVLMWILLCRILADYFSSRGCQQTLTLVAFSALLTPAPSSDYLTALQAPHSFFLENRKCLFLCSLFQRVVLPHAYSRWLGYFVNIHIDLLATQAASGQVNCFLL